MRAPRSVARLSRRGTLRAVMGESHRSRQVDQFFVGENRICSTLNRKTRYAHEKRERQTTRFLQSPLHMAGRSRIVRLRGRWKPQKPRGFDALRACDGWKTSRHPLPRGDRGWTGVGRLEQSEFIRDVCWEFNWPNVAV